jgi:L-lysine 2,3-aminomutase
MLIFATVVWKSSAISFWVSQTVSSSRRTSILIAPVADGLNILEHLRGYTSGLAVPTFIITAPEGKGKTPLAPTYLLNPNRKGKLLFRTWGGYVCEYEDEVPGE